MPKSDAPRSDWAKWAVYAQLVSDLSGAVGDLYEQVEKLQTVVTVLAENQQDIERRLAALELQPEIAS